MVMKDTEQWKKIKKLGMVRFVILYGLLGFGLILTVLSFFIERIWMYGLNVSAYFDNGWLRALFEELIQWMLTGIIWGILMWFLFIQRLSK